MEVEGLVLEADRDPVWPERPEILAQGVLELAFPLPLEKRLDLGAAGDELVAVAPDGVDRVRGSDPCRVTGVPGSLGGRTF